MLQHMWASQQSSSRFLVLHRLACSALMIWTAFEGASGRCVGLLQCNYVVLHMYMLSGYIRSTCYVFVSSSCSFLFLSTLAIATHIHMPTTAKTTTPCNPGRS